jgi:hypothetical protein
MRMVLIWEMRWAMLRLLVILRVIRRLLIGLELVLTVLVVDRVLARRVVN